MKAHELMHTLDCGKRVVHGRWQIARITLRMDDDERAEQRPCATQAI